MSILLTSKFIQNMYENERDEDEDENEENNNQSGGRTNRIVTDRVRGIIGARARGF